MDCHRRRVSEMIVDLGNVKVLAADDTGGLLRVHVRRRTSRSPWGTCGGSLWSDGDRWVELVDLPVFGRATRLVWHKQALLYQYVRCEAVVDRRVRGGW